MKLAVILAVGLAAVASAKKAKKEAEYSFEWEYYKPKVLKERVPKQGLQAVASYKVTVGEDIHWSTLEMVKKEEMEYFGNSADDANEEIVLDKDGPCGHQYVRDCKNKCAPAYWIGNGLCDDGKEKDRRVIDRKDVNGVDMANSGRGSYNFACKKFWMDGGDCPKEISGKTSNILRMAHRRFMDHRRYAMKTALNLAKNSNVAVPIVAVAAMAVVAAAAVVMKRQ